MTLIEKVRMEKELLEKDIDLLAKELSQAPDGCLERYKNGKYHKFYHCVKNSRTGRRTRSYVRKKDITILSGLANKAFCKILIKEYKKRLLVIEYFLRHFLSQDPAVAAYEKLPEWERALISPPFDEIGKEMAEWGSASYNENPYFREYRTIPAGDGLLVRSKSEAYIAKALKANRIPFRYDSELVLDGIVLYPDFVIRHPKTGQFFLWEHWGRLDEIKYKNRTMTKMRDYIDAGYFPMSNFIMTSEGPGHPLAFGLVDSLIDYYFL